MLLSIRAFLLRIVWHQLYKRVLLEVGSTKGKEEVRVTIEPTVGLEIALYTNIVGRGTTESRRGTSDSI